MYSSNWNGTSTDELTLSGGNIVIHSGFSADSNKSIVVQSDAFTFKLSTNKNPFVEKGEIDLESDDEKSLVTYMVFDGNNKLIMTQTLPPNESFIFDRNVRSGTYLVIARQGDHVDQIRMIKE